MQDNYIQNIKQEVIASFKDGKFQDSEIDYILFNPNTEDIVISVDRNKGLSLEILLNKKEKGKYRPIRASDWNFSVYEYIINYLDNDYEIVDIKLPIHHVAWKEISKKYPNDYYFKGVYKYLQYCKDNEITKEKLEKKFNEKLDDIMIYYWKRKKWIEENDKYVCDTYENIIDKKEIER